MTQKTNLNQIVANHRISKSSKNKNKFAKLYIKNGAIISNKKPINYPDYNVPKNFKFTIKNLPSKLNQNSFYITKQKTRSLFSPRGQIIKLPGSTLNLKRKRKYNFYQKNYKNLTNVKTFYSLDNVTVKKYKKLKQPGTLTSHFIKNVERRLDVILVRLGYANHIPHARQLILKGVIFVDNIKIKNKHYLLNAGSTVETRDSSFPFLSLYRYHLEHYPKSWLRIKRKRQKPWIRKLKNTQETQSLSLTELNKLSSIKLKKKLLWKKGAWKKSVKKRPFRCPIATLPQQFTKLGSNKTLITHFYKNKDINLPHSISATKGRL